MKHGTWPQWTQQKDLKQRQRQRHQQQQQQQVAVQIALMDLI
jgi:hypothetical protein